MTLDQSGSNTSSASLMGSTTVTPDMDEDVFAFKPYPWQRKVIEFATEEEADERAILWAYSIEGDVSAATATETDDSSFFHFTFFLP